MKKLQVTFCIPTLLAYALRLPAKTNYSGKNNACLVSLTCLLIFLLTSFTNLSAQSSKLVWMDGGSLSYAPFAVQGQSNEVHVVPDFSYAGYQGGGVAIPTAPVVRTLSPSGGDDTPAIQAAIDYVESLPRDANGFRGAVLLQAGRYNINRLFIEESGVVLRGKGQGLDGTILFAQLPEKHDAITLQGRGGGFDRQGSSRRRIISPYVPIGSYSFEIADPAIYQVGDTITVRRTPNQFWIDDLGMDEATLCANDTGCNGWTPGSYSIYHERVITAVAGNTITINIPIVDVMEDKYGGGEIMKASVPGRIEQCGVEKLRIESYYDPNNPQDEDHAWIAVRLKRVMNSWVKNVTGQHLGYGTVSISNESNFNTIQECASIDHISQIRGGRRYSFNISDGLGNLIQRCYTREGRHDLAMGSRVTGPNVFLDNYSTNTHSDIGPHHRWTTGTLFDNVYGGQIQVQNRGSSGSGHGWAGNTTMFWNVVSYKRNIKVESPRGGMNWGIGNAGLQQTGTGYWESWNTPVLPRSLYLQQLEDRLGSQAVEDITIPEQRSGDIYDLLAAWAGEGEFGEPASTQITYPLEDAFVRAGIYSDNNYGADDQLIVKENTGSDNNDRMSFLKFDLSDVVTQAIKDVRLRLYVSNAPPNPVDNALHLVTDDSWTELGVTWNNQPAADGLIGTKKVTTKGEWIEYDITEIANAEIAGDGILSLRLSEATVGNYYAFSSREEKNLDRDPHIVYTPFTDPVPPTEPDSAAIALLKQGTFQDENGDGNAQLGETITYTFTLSNTGEVPLSNIEISDSVLNISGGPLASLAVGTSDSLTFLGSYVLTQADIKAGEVRNQSTVRAEGPDGASVSDLSDPINIEQDKPTVIFLPAPDPDPNPDPTPESGIALIKTAQLNDSNNNGCTEVGETITYSFAVSNTGNQALTDISISDSLLEASDPVIPIVFIDGDQNDNGILDVNETWNYSAEYLISQAEIGQGFVKNQALVKGTPVDTTKQVYSDLWGKNGELWDPDSSRLKNFSDVGYMQGNEPIPDWPVGVYVTDFGAIPNDGLDDSQAFNEAIAACPVGQAVFIPNGKYTILQQVLIEHDSVVIRGEDMYKTIIFFPKYLNEIFIQEVGFDYDNPRKRNTGERTFFLVEDGTHRSFENLTFECREQRKKGHWEHIGANPILFRNVTNSWVRNVYMKNVDHGLTMSSRADHISFLNIIFDNFAWRRDKIDGHVAFRMPVSKCLFHNIEIIGRYSHEFDMFGGTKGNVVSNVKGIRPRLHNHGPGINNNLYTNINFGANTGTTAGDSQTAQTYWNLYGEKPLSTDNIYPDLEKDHLYVGYDANIETTTTKEHFWFESIDPKQLYPQNIYLAQLKFFGKPLPEGPPPPPPSPTGGSIWVDAIDDNSVSSGNPDNVRDPNNDHLQARNTNYFKFDLRNIELKSIHRVRLVLTSYFPSNPPLELAVFSVEHDDWTEETITYNNSPALLSQVDRYFVPEDVSGSNYRITFDVTSLVQEEYAKDRVVTLATQKKSGNGHGFRISTNYGPFAPVLIIEQEPDPVPGPPSPPTGMRSKGLIGNIQLDWKDNPEPDVVKYNVYRRTSPGAPEEYPASQGAGLLTSDFLDLRSTTNWQVGMMEHRSLYFYRITAVDEYGYESEKSTEFVGAVLTDENAGPAFPSENIILSTAQEGQNYSESLANWATDPENDPLYFFKIDGPDWLNIAYDGTLNGTPPPGSVGKNQVSVQVVALGGQDVAQIEINIEPGIETEFSDPYQGKQAVSSLQYISAENRPMNKAYPPVQLYNKTPPNLASAETALALEATTEVSDLSGTAIDNDTPTTTVLCQAPPTNPAIALLISGVFTDENGDGQAQVGETINYTFTVSNTGDVALSDIIITDSLLSVTGGPLASLAIGASNALTFTASYVLTQADIKRGSVSNQSTVSAEAPDNSTVSDLSDDDSLLEDDPTVVTFLSLDLCGIEDLEILADYCPGDSLALIDLQTFDLDLPNVEQYTFQVWIDSVAFGEINLSQIPATLEIPATLLSGELTRFKICPSAGEGCCLSGLIRTKECVDNCPINEVSTEIVKCLPNGNFDLFLEVDYEDSFAGESLKVYIEGKESYIFEAFDGGYLLQDVVLSKDKPQFEIKVCPGTFTIDSLILSDECCRSILVDKEDCEVIPPIDPCAIIGAPKIESTECDENGQFYLRLDFEFENASEHFIVVGPDDSRQRFAYDALPVQLGPFTGAIAQTLVWEIVDEQDEDCSILAEFGPYDNCQATCEISEVKTYNLECDPNTGLYSFTLAIEGKNLGEVFQLSNGNGFTKRLEYSDQALSVKGVPLPDGNIDQLEICFSVQPDSTFECCYEFEVEIDCEIEEVCTISELFTKSMPCEADGSFFFELDFSHDNTSKGFDLSINGQAIGAYRYEDLPVKVGPITSAPKGNGQYEVKVEDWEKDCYATTEMEACAESSGCAFGSVELITTDCNNGFFRVVAKIEFSNPKEGDFLVFAEGELFGPYRYGEDQPLDLGPFRGDGLTNYDFLFVDLDDPSCLLWQELGAVNCDEEECAINNLDLDVLECNEDGSYKMYIDFDFSGTDSEFFSLYDSKSNILDTYQLDALPLKVDLSFPEEDLLQQITICIEDQPECCMSKEIQLSDCAEEECKEITFQANPLGCNSNGLFNVLLDIDLDLTEAYPIIIEVNGDFYDSLQLTDPSVEIGPFPADSSYNISIIDGRNTDCVSEFELGKIDCPQDDDSVVWPGDANEDNIANYIDLLNLGIAWNNQGPERTLPGSRWTGVPASNWGRRFADVSKSGDFKHADCNGDGIVDEVDIEVIYKNYNLRHGLEKEPLELPTTDLDPPVFFEIPGPEGLPDSGYFNIPIVLGTQAKPLSNIYGVAFIVEFDPELIDPNDVEIHLLSSWLGTPDENLQSVFYHYLGEGKIEISITRTDQNEVSGHGGIAMFRAMRRNIDDDSESQLDVTQGIGTNIRKRLIRLDGLSKVAKFGPEPTVREYGYIDLKRSIQVYPNPTSNMINVNNFYGAPIDAIQILSTNGQTISSRYEDRTSLNVSNLPSGMYLIRVEIGGYIIHKKFFKTKFR